MSTLSAVTFDFHDTLASCDRWFELEVRSLPAEVLGLLVDSGALVGPMPDREVVTTAYRDLRGEIIGHGIELDASACLVETYRRVGLEVHDATLAGPIDMLMREALTDVEPMPGAIETVRSLHAAGFKLGVVSSAVYHPFLTWVLGGFEILPLFRTVVTSASAGFYKSRSEIYHRALADLDTAASSSCHVGDSLRWDHQTAKSIGMRTVLVTAKDIGSDDDLPAPDLLMTSLVGAADAIQALSGMCDASTRR